MSSSQFSVSQQKKALSWLVFFHILIIVASNYLVQLPIKIFGYHMTWGAFTFPFIFVATDLTVRIFGAPLARRIIFLVMIPALLLSYIISTLFSGGLWTSFSSLLTFNSVVARIAFASFGAYVFGQLLDILVFNRFRQSRHWWLAPASSGFAGNAIDTLVFFFIAFYKSADPFMALHWPEIAFSDYIFKVVISLLLFLPIYGVILNILIKRLTNIKLKINHTNTVFNR